MKRKSWLIISLFTILFVFNCLNLIQNVNAISDINYTFIDNQLYNSDSIDYTDNFNLQDTYNNTGVYNATYTFTDEVGLTGTEITSFVDSIEGGNNNCTVISNLDGHQGVLLISTIDDTGTLIRNSFSSNINSGTIELWVRTTNAEVPTFYIYLYETNSIRIKLMINDDEWRVDDNVGSWRTICSATENVWYHIGIDFNVSTDTFDFYLNGVLIESDITFDTTANSINNIKLIGESTVNRNSYFDAIGYSWQPIYDFNDDIIGNEPIGWTSDNDDNCTTNIIESFDFKYNVLELYDNNNTGNLEITVPINQEANQIIEFDIAKSSIVSDKDLTISFREGSEFLIKLKLIENDLYSEQAPPPNDIIKENFITTNNFFHVKMILNDTTNTFNCYIDDILEANDLDYLMSSSISIDNIWFTTFNTHYQFSCYIDNLALSSKSGYEIGDNMYPNYIISGELEVIQDEFAFDENGELYDTGVSNANGWIGSPSEDVYLIIDEAQPYDRQFNIYSTTTAVRQIEKIYATTGNDLINVSVDITKMSMNNLNSYFEWTIFAPDLTIITIHILKNAVGDIKLQYYNGSTYINLMTLDNTITLNRTLKLSINDTCLLSYKDDNTPIEFFDFSKQNEGDGLHKVFFRSIMDDSSSYQYIFIDGMKAMVNDTNLTDDYGLFFHNLNISTWSSQYHNLIKIDSKGYYGFGYYADITDFKSLRGFNNYTGINNYNIYDKVFYINNPILCFITNKSLEVLEITISGVKMNDGISNFIPDFYYESVNIDESYFYVDSSNKLQFSLIADDNNTEWIELRFDILFRATENRSIQFKSNIDGISTGYVHLAYWGFAITNIYFPTYLKTTTSYLPQGYVIFTMSIIISDQDITWYDNCNGYITNLKLLYTPGGFIPIDILYFDISGLVVVLIPLIILLAPTLALSIKFGKKIILPMFIFMSLLCAITNLIPIWLFFVIAIACGSLIFVSQKEV